MSTLAAELEITSAMHAIDRAISYLAEVSPSHETTFLVSPALRKLLEAHTSLFEAKVRLEGEATKALRSKVSAIVIGGAE